MVTGRSWSATERVENYVLTLQYKIAPIADSGIYLKDTPQVRIWDTRSESSFKRGNQLGSGGLFNNSPGAVGKNPLILADRPVNSWNHLVIVQVGARTTVELNGHRVVDNAVMENYWDRTLPLRRRGSIQLQTHGGEVRFRDIRGRLLDDDQANSVLLEHQEVSYEKIFDGDSLSGWIGATDDYEVVNDPVRGGAIVNRSGSGGHLYYDKTLSDFEVKLEFRLPPGGNNGLAIRSPGQGDPAYAAMCELQVLDNSAEQYADLDPRQRHGSVYGIAAARTGYLRPPGRWNFQHVRVSGSRITVELNGYEILDTDVSQATSFLDDREHPGLRREEGYFGLAGHGDPVAYRGLRVRKIVSPSQDFRPAAQ